MAGPDRDPQEPPAPAAGVAISGSRNPAKSPGNPSHPPCRPRRRWLLFLRASLRPSKGRRGGAERQIKTGTGARYEPSHDEEMGGEAEGQREDREEQGAAEVMGTVGGGVGSRPSATGSSWGGWGGCGS